MNSEAEIEEKVSPREHNHGKLCPQNICSFVHVCPDCIASQINEANLLPKNSTFLCSTLLSPSINSSKQGKLNLQYLKNNILTLIALELYIKGMNRDCDRSQRNLCLSSAIEIAPNFREALLCVSCFNFIFSFVAFVYFFNCLVGVEY